MTNLLTSEIVIKQRQHDEPFEVYDVTHDGHPMGWLYGAEEGPAWGWCRHDRKNSGQQESWWQALTALLETFGKHGRDRRYDIKGPFRAAPLHYKASDRILEVVEGVNGYYLYYNWARDQWDSRGIGDGVEMFTGEDNKALSPGTQPFNKAMADWVERNGHEIVDAYFPDRADDYYVRNGHIVASQREGLQRAIRNAIKRAGDTPITGLGLVEMVLPHLTIRAMEQIVRKLEDNEE